MNTLFGTKHLIILAVCLVVIVLGVKFARKMPLTKLCRRMLHIGVVSEVIKVFYYILANESTYGGILPKSDLPFHLCSLQILFILIVVCTENPKIKELLLSFMMPSCLCGGVAALLIATQSSLNGGWIISLQYFGYHCAIAIFGISLMTSQQLRLTGRNLLLCLKFLLAVFLLSVYINSALYDGNFSPNFMYVSSPPQSGLPFLNEDQGWLVYILRYALLVLVCVGGCYAYPLIKNARAKGRKEAAK